MQCCALSKPARFNGTCEIYYFNHPLVLKIPSHFSNNKSEGYADIVTVQAVYPPGLTELATDLCMTCRTPFKHCKTRSELNAVTLGRKLTYPPVES